MKDECLLDAGRDIAPGLLLGLLSQWFRETKLVATFAGL